MKEGKGEGFPSKVDSSLGMNSNQTHILKLVERKGKKGGIERSERKPQGKGKTDGEKRKVNVLQGRLPRSVREKLNSAVSLLLTLLGRGRGEGGDRPCVPGGGRRGKEKGMGVLKIP